MSKRKRNDGTQLEKLVTYIEGLHLPDNWTITPRALVKNEDGQVDAELDILIQGPVGTTHFSWLIECRDRPKGGRQSASWIEQLTTRRTRFNLSKVTAVSTTGFSGPALRAAKKFDIDIREFRTLSPEEFAQWPELKHMPIRVDYVNVTKVTFAFKLPTPPEADEAIREFLKTPEVGASVRDTKTDELISTHSIFQKIIDKNPELLDDLKVNGPALPVHFKVTAPEGHAYLLDTSAGSVEVAFIKFDGSVQRTETSQPLLTSSEYLQSATQKPITRIRLFEPHAILGANIQPELHDLPDGEGTLFVLRHVQKEK